MTYVPEVPLRCDSVEVELISGDRKATGIHVFLMASISQWRLNNIGTLSARRLAKNVAIVSAVDATGTYNPFVFIGFVELREMWAARQGVWKGLQIPRFQCWIWSTRPDVPKNTVLR
jgi:hypothetical protein